MLPAERVAHEATAAPQGQHFAVPNGRRGTLPRDEHARGDDDASSAGGNLRRRLLGYTYTRRRLHADNEDASEALTRKLHRPLSRTIADTAAEALHKSRNGQPLPPNECLVGVAFPNIDGELWRPSGSSVSPDARNPLAPKWRGPRSSYDPATIGGDGGDERLPPRLMDAFGNPYNAGKASDRTLADTDRRGGTPREADDAMAFHSFFASPSRPERSRTDPLANARFTSL
jgi:hypothetical protein